MCKVTMETSTGGTTTPAGGTTQTVACNKAMTIKATASSGYLFREWTKTKGNGSFANSKSGNTTFTPTSDATIKANFDKQQDPCDPSNTYNIKVTEQCNDAGCSMDNGINNVLSGGPWWNSNPSLSRDGTGTFTGGTEWTLHLFNPGGGTLNGKETYIKKLTVNGQSKNPITYSTVVCSDQNVVIEYGVRAQTAKQNVDIQYYVDNVHVDTKSTTVIQGQTFQYTAESDYKGGQANGQRHKHVNKC